MRLHVDALYTHDAGGRLLAVNDRNGAIAPRFFLGRTANGNAWWFRHDVDPAVANDLAARCAPLSTGIDPDVGSGIADALIACLSRDQPVRKTWAGPAFRFPEELSGSKIAVPIIPDNATVLSPYLEDWRDDVGEGVPMMAVLEDGHAVSVCASVRMTPLAHEAGVETHRDFRGRGHAAEVVAAWAKSVAAPGRIPLYSTSWENAASRAVARKLRL